MDNERLASFKLKYRKAGTFIYRAGIWIDNKISDLFVEFLEYEDVLFTAGKREKRQA